MMFPTNRYQRSGAALALAMPWWTVLVALLATAICEPLSDIGAIFIAAGTRLLTSAGKRKLKDGKRRIANGTDNSCCCCAYDSSCSFCDTTPGRYTVTLAGWSGRACYCTDYKATGTINGTYSLTGAGTCAWTAEYTGAGYDSSFGCGATTSSNPMSMFVLQKFASTAYYLMGYIPNGDFMQWRAVGATATVASGQCNSSFSMTEIAQDCNGTSNSGLLAFFSGLAFTGGTVSVTPC